MNYWLDLFTGTTWREYREAGAIISGFRGREATVAKRVQPDDIVASEPFRIQVSACGVICCALAGLRFLRTLRAKRHGLH
jgi:hypothetical protein